MLNCITYHKAMTGSDIARELGVSRQAVSQILRKAVSKVYTGLIEEKVTESPLETVKFMRDWFGVEVEDDIKQFLDMLPSDVLQEVRDEARAM